MRREIHVSANQVSAHPHSSRFASALRSNQYAVPTMQISIIGITNFPEVTPGDDLQAMILAGCEAQGTALEQGDVLVVTQKIVSKAEGQLVNLEEITPSPLA